jgi:NADPH:quinone reductase-like Zn-dependent oxidoreductase
MHKAHTGELAPKPRFLDDVQAVAVPLSALTAWQAFFEYAGLVAGQTVLIHGAAGGVGVFATHHRRSVSPFSGEPGI